MGRVLLPLLTGALHPAVRRLAEFVRRPGKEAAAAAGRRLPPSRNGTGRAARGRQAVRPSPAGNCCGRLGGEIAEVSALAAGEHVEPRRAGAGVGPLRGAAACSRRPTLPAARRGISGWPWSATAAGRSWCFRSAGRRRLFSTGATNPANLGKRRGTPGTRGRRWWHGSSRPWRARRAAPVAGRRARAGAGRRRPAQRRTSPLLVLDYQEASEETGFKGTMTLVGCGLLWGLLLILGLRTGIRRCAG